MRCSAGSTGCSPATPRRSPPPITEVERLKPRYRGQGRAGRQSGARSGRAARRTCRSRRSTKSRRSRSWSPAEARARRCSGKVVPEGLGLLPPSLRHRLQVIQQCRPDDIERGARPLCRARHPGRADDLYRGHARQARRGASGDRAAPGASTIAELTAAGRPGDPHPAIRRRPTITRPPTRAKWPRRAARG